MKELADKIQAFMYCSYNDPAEYVTEEWLKDKTNLETIIKILSYSIADDLKGLADGIYDEDDAFGITVNVEWDFELLKALKQINA